MVLGATFTPVATDQRCPQCGAPLEIIKNGIVSEPFAPRYPLRHEPLPRRERLGTYALCTGCDFGVEITRG